MGHQCSTSGFPITSILDIFICDFTEIRLLNGYETILAFLEKLTTLAKQRSVMFAFDVRGVKMLCTHLSWYAPLLLHSEEGRLFFPFNNPFSLIMKNKTKWRLRAALICIISFRDWPSCTILVHCLNECFKPATPLGVVGVRYDETVTVCAYWK